MELAPALLPVIGDLVCIDLAQHRPEPAAQLRLAWQRLARAVEHVFDRAGVDLDLLHPTRRQREEREERGLGMLAADANAEAYHAA
jgi:hypothetical protein